MSPPGCPGALHIVFQSSVSGAPRAQPAHLVFTFCLGVRPGGALHLISPLLSPGATRRRPTPDFPSSVPGAPRHSPLHLVFTLLSPGAPGPRPSSDFPLLSGCAPAQPYTLFPAILSPGAPGAALHLLSLFCLRVRPGCALHLISSILSPGAPGAALHLSFPLLSPGAPGRSPTSDFSILSPGAPRHCPTPDFPLLSPGAALHLISSSVSGCAPGGALHLVFHSSVPGAPRRSPTPVFTLRSPGAPGAALHLIFLFCVRVRPGVALTPSFHSSVSGSALAQLLPLIFLFSVRAPRRSPTPYFTLLPWVCPWRSPTPDFPLQSLPGVALPCFPLSVCGAPLAQPLPLIFPSSSVQCPSSNFPSSDLQVHSDFRYSARRSLSLHLVFNSSFSVRPRLSVNKSRVRQLFPAVNSLLSWCARRGLNLVFSSPDAPVIPGGALPSAISSILSRVRRRSHSLVPLSSVFPWCAPAPPYSDFPSLSGCAFGLPGLSFFNAVPSALFRHTLPYVSCSPAQPYTASVFCPRVRPGAALHLVFTLLSPGAPGLRPTSDFQYSVPG
ncbi:hypothetical protein CDAR_405911 [Caerostris darwini]|uniref:Uncharacterized protein n=1 Tax=Caerostris darwini TaxID=1538125 RepID=A0AAV4TF10_9ARAC|nr:hypothetical protein CDAR_405911 [Caerostris darwini]